MNSVSSLFIFTALMSAASVLAESPVVLAIHGGAGVSRAELSAEKEAACRETLAEALRNE